MKYKRLKLSLIVGLMASLCSIGVRAQAPVQLSDTTLTYKYNGTQQWKVIYGTLSDGTKLFFGKTEMDTTYMASGYFLLSLFRIESQQQTLDIPGDYVYLGHPASLEKVVILSGEYQCDFLSITVPEGTEVFYLPTASALTTLNLPPTIVDLDFTFSDSFKDLYLRSVYPPHCGNIGNKSLANVTIHVPAMAMDLYANTSPYKSGNLVALEEPVQHIFTGYQPDITIQSTEGLGTDALLTVPRWYSSVSWANGKKGNNTSTYVLSHNDEKAYKENYSGKTPVSYGNQQRDSFYPAQLTVNAESPLNLKTFRLEQDCGEYYFGSYEHLVNKAKYKITPSTAIFNSPVTAQEIEMTYHIFRTQMRWKGEYIYAKTTCSSCSPENNYRYYLISFPFDIKLSDITFPYLQNKWNMEVICMEFDGDKHAKSASSGYWRQLSKDEVLHANQGYLINFYGRITNADKEADSFQQTTLHVKAMDTEKKQQIFTNGDVSVPLNANPSKYKQRQGWNLIGNPYPCFFDIHHLDFTAPITVYDGFSYFAFSPIDDDYYLYPNEAFFVQCPEGVTSLTFMKEGRLHDDPNGLWQFNASSSQVPARRQMPGSASDRRVYNFLLNGEDGFDRTRIVINEQASTDYELEHDAAKMMGQGGPQLYVLDGGVQYAIDERPLENGVFSLGMLFSAAGSYVLSLHDNPDEQTPVYLTDLLTGTETDLTETAYTFDAAAGVATDRFSVRIGAKMPTPVQDVSDYSGEPVYYDLQGRIITDPSAMQNGGYILKQGQTTRKIVK